MLLPNLGQGKTEAVLTLSGPGSKRVRLDTFQGSTPTLAIPTELWQGARLRLVAGYKHLGGIISATGDLHVELRSRVGAAWQAYRKHRRKVFGSPIVSTRDKSILFSSLVESTLYYGVGSWPHVGARIVDKLQATLVSMARTMLRPTFDLESACHKSACYILSSARILSAASAVHVARLRHFQSVVRKASVGGCMSSLPLLDKPLLQLSLGNGQLGSSRVGRLLGKGLLIGVVTLPCFESFGQLRISSSKDSRCGSSCALAVLCQLK